MTKLYFASPLFTEMELSYNQFLADQIRQALPHLEIYLPQEQGEINDKEAYADSKMIAKADTDALLDSNILLAVLDGQVIDPGVATEIGVAYQAGIPILGLFTDTRQKGGNNKQKLAALQEVCESQFAYINLYTVGLIKMRGEIVTQSKEVPAALERLLEQNQSNQ